MSTADMLTTGVYGYPFDYVLWLLLYASLLVHTFCFLKLFPGKRRRVKLVLGNALVFACMVGAISLAAETYLRFLYVATDSFGVTLPARRWFLLYANNNSYGFRDHQWTESPRPDVERIAFVGDSFTWGWGVEDPRDRFSDVIGARLESASPGRFEVLNLSGPGWDTGDEEDPVLAAIDRWGARQIILCYVPNDIERILPFPSDTDPTRPPELKWFNTDSSMLAEFLWYRIFIRNQPGVRDYQAWLAQGYEDPETWKAQQARLHRIIELCRTRNVLLRVVLLPYLRTGEALDQVKIYNRLEGFLKREDVDVLNLASVFATRNASELVVNRWDSHPNANAHAILAGAMLDRFFGGTLSAP